MAHRAQRYDGSLYERLFRFGLIVVVAVVVVAMVGPRVSSAFGCVRGSIASAEDCRDPRASAP